MFRLSKNGRNICAYRVFTFDKFRLRLFDGRFFNRVKTNDVNEVILPVMTMMTSFFQNFLGLKVATLANLDKTPDLF